MAKKADPAFFAYPGHPVDLTSTIEAAARLANGPNPNSRVITWPDMGVFGSQIPDQVRENIRNSSVFIFDVTRPNANVYYEAGFAIGVGKPVAPVLNSSFQNASSDIQRDGLFDNIGYKSYENSTQLAAIIEELPGSNLISLYGKELETQQPLFILDTLKKTDFRNAIVSAVKSSKVHFRSFDPVEVPRLSAVAMVGQVSSSSGIVLPILAEHIEDSARHNLRAAFLAGLAHGLERQTLLLQHRHQIAQNPADYREFVTSVSDDKTIREQVEDFCKQALLAGQSIKRTAPRGQKSALQKLTLGSSAAENEFRTLSNYFVETAEFHRTTRGEINVVAGRKGSGKTAIFFQSRDHFREDKDSYVTDLKPESHQLSLFREELRKIVDVGAFDHTLAAFWYFLLLTEVVLTMKRDLEHKARFDGRLLQAIREIEGWLSQYQIGDSGDFTTRINRLSRYIVQEIEAVKKRGHEISADLLTNIIFRGGITELKKLILKHTTTRSPLIVLFDNIDKGWPANGVDEFDIRLVRLLIEALDKIKRDFAAADRDFSSVVFLRNDIYELMVQATPDRGKAGQVRIDWTDRAKLKQVIYRRLQASLKMKTEPFDKLWGMFFPSTVQGRDSFDFFVDHCLMRPRFLINIIENAISNAINRGHSNVDAVDCIDAVRQHSLYLVDDFGFEIQDVSGLSADLLYSLVGTEQSHNRDEFLEKFVSFGLSQDESERAFVLMLWYGVIGINARDGRDKYIYDFEYNAKRLEAEAKLLGADARYVTNPALHVALSS